MRLSPIILVLAICLDDGFAHRSSSGEQVRGLEVQGRFRPPAVRVSQKRAAKWTAKVDSRIDNLQKEVATAQARAHSAERTIRRLHAKQDAELAHAKAERIHHPKGGLTDEDIKREYGKLLKVEQEDLEHQEQTIKVASESLRKMGRAKRKIVRAAMGVVAIDQVARMKANQHKKEAKELHAAMKKADEQASRRERSAEARSAWHKQSAAYDKEHAAAKEAQKAQKAQKEVAEEVTNSEPAAADTEAGIIERIELASDADISKQTAKVSGDSKKIAKWKYARKMIRSRMQKLRQAAKKNWQFSASELAKTNKVLQEKANAEATLKLTQAQEEKESVDPPKQYETEYHAFQMTNTAEHNVTEAADMAEIAERTTNLKQWETEHEEHEHKLVKDQLARLADADDKNAALNRISMQANQLNQEKVALENLAKLKAETKKIRDAQKAEAKNTEAPLPKVPEEYQAPATQDGKEDISNSNVVSALNAKIESAQQKIAEATREQDAVPVPDSKKPTSTALPKSLQNKMNTVKDGIQSIDEVTGTP